MAHRPRQARRAPLGVRGLRPGTVAGFTEARLERLTLRPDIIRDRRKIEAVRTNARAVVRMRVEEDGLESLVLSHRPGALAPRTHADVPTRSPLSETLARALRARGFTFVGPTSVYALMEATGMIDTHLVTCHRRGASGPSAQGRRPAATR